MNTDLFNTTIANTPGPFKSKLERIRRNLHLGKASVMVGAGFSRNAEVPSHIQVKQWDGVGKDIYCRLNAVEKADDSALVFKTPMRLASQFEAVFGRNELDNLIKDSIPDDRLTPGPLHKQLLALPWRDVFTTNYDTLLEKARIDQQRSYSVVTSKSMLIYKKSPRIIKLHGSFPDKTPFLMTEEDFRTYPQKYPEFVNTVRQALVESIFCLIGFSGDDPNFTSWQGWLRDVMGDYAGPSYLITCDNSYDQSFQSLMASRGIEVLNFAELGFDDHASALDFFFTYLSRRESTWTGRLYYDSRDVKIEELLPKLQAARTSYPGWFILPVKYYQHFEDMHTTFPYMDHVLPNLDLKQKELLLFELDWRADISLSFKDFDWYRSALEECVASYGENPLSPEAINLGISLLRLYRHHFDKQDEAEELYSRLVGEKARMTQSQLSKFYYTASGNALSLLDYDKLSGILKDWAPTSSNYEGIIYKSLVLAEAKGPAPAAELLGDAFERVTQSLIQSTTEEEISIRCIIENLIAFYSGEQMPNLDARFSFVDIRNSILRKVNESTKKPFEIRHNFAIGSENRSWNHNTGTSREILYSYRYLLFCEAYGFPFGFAESPVDERILASILPSIVSFGIGYSLGPVLRSGHRDVIEAYATRATFNYLSRKQADWLAAILMDSASRDIVGGAALKHRITEVLLPLISRLSASCSPAVVTEIFHFAHKTYRLSRFPKTEDISIIYDNAMPECIQDIYSQVYTTEIYLDGLNKDIPYPTEFYHFFTPGETEISIIQKSLTSKDKPIREFAFRRATRLLHAKISSEQKSQLEELVRSWREVEEPSKLTRFSYSQVIASPEEKATVRKLAKSDLSMFLDSDYSFNGNSAPISSFADCLNNLCCLVEYLKPEQINSVLNKITTHLIENKEQYSKDDSKDSLGGLRRFTNRLFRYIGEFVRQITLNGFSDKKTAKELFLVMDSYLDTKLPVLLTMDRLNLVARVIGKDKMRDKITAHILSDNEIVVMDSCSALIHHSKNKGEVQKILQKLIFISAFSSSDVIRLYLQTLAQIPLDVLSNNSKCQLAEMLRSVLENVPKLSLTEEWKVDIMRAGVELASKLKCVSKESPLYNVMKIWEEYAMNDEVYNDIRRPWFDKSK